MRKYFYHPQIYVLTILPQTFFFSADRLFQSIMQMFLLSVCTFQAGNVERILKKYFSSTNNMMVLNVFSHEKAS